MSVTPHILAAFTLATVATTSSAAMILSGHTPNSHTVPAISASACSQPATTTLFRATEPDSNTPNTPNTPTAPPHPQCAVSASTPTAPAPTLSATVTQTTYRRLLER